MKEQLIENIDNSTNSTTARAPSLSEIAGGEVLDSNYEELVHEAARRLADQFVRHKGKYVHVDHLGSPLSADDARELAVEYLRTEYPAAADPDFLKDVIGRTFGGTTDDPREKIALWGGKFACRPDVKERVIRDPLLAKLNTWSKPRYRDIIVPKPSLGLFLQYLDLAVVEQFDRDQLLYWMAWNLQNEADKPGWAPFLYSSCKGTGKSSFARLWSRLIGEHNMMTANGIESLAGRFSLPFVANKSVCIEELEVNLRYKQWNKLKTFITEQSGSGERKGVDIEKFEQCACIIMTSNNYPSWLEADERRVLLVNCDHDGHASGPKADEFHLFMSKFHAWMSDDKNIASIYQYLMKLRLPDSFNAKVLNVARIATPLMQRVKRSSLSVAAEQLAEALREDGRKAISQSDLLRMAKCKLILNPSQLPHLLTELGWYIDRVKWGKKDYARAVWVMDGYVVERGRVTGPDDYDFPVDEQPGGKRFLEV